MVVGLLILACGMLGIPFTNGLIPQAPLHVRALAKIKLVPDVTGFKREVFESVCEQRLSGLSQAVS